MAMYERGGTSTTAQLMQRAPHILGHALMHVGESAAQAQGCTTDISVTAFCLGESRQMCPFLFGRVV